VVTRVPVEDRPMPDDKKPTLERLGLDYFKRREDKMPPVVCMDDIQYLNPTERSALRSIQTWTIVRAGVAGGLSGLASAIAEMAANATAAGHGAEDSVERMIYTWGIVLGVTAVATTFEIGFLYWDAMRSVHNMARAAGVNLFSGTDIEQGVLTPLVRAALELPNPNQAVLGIHPYHEISKLRVVLATLMYKLKISVTNFLTKMLIRRLMGRAAVRTWLPLVAAPVTAAWNAWVMWRVLRQARLRVMGPFAAGEYLDAIAPDPGSISAEGKLHLVQAVGVAVVRKRDMHPNLKALLVQTTQRLGMSEPDDDSLSDWLDYLDDLQKLPRSEQAMSMRLLAAAIIIDGRRGAREIMVLREAHRVTERRFEMRALSRLYRSFVRGDAFDAELLERIGGDTPNGQSPTAAESG